MPRLEDEKEIDEWQRAHGPNEDVCGGEQGCANKRMHFCERQSMLTCQSGVLIHKFGAP